MKTHFKKMKNTNYIGSWDLFDTNGKVVNRVVTITKVEKQEVFDGSGSGKSEQCPVAELKECKPFILNVTNMKAIAKALESPFIEDWAGKRIELTVKKIKSFGEFVDALRVLDKAPAAAASLPQLTPDNDKWAGVVKALFDGFTMQQIKGKYTISGEHEAQLVDEVNAMKEGKNV